MSIFTATLAVWPHSTGESASRDREACGGPAQQVSLQADDILKALEIAEVFAAGIRTNPRVWEVHITSIVKEPHT